MASKTEVQIGNYILDSSNKIGEGSFGKVFKGWLASDKNQEICIKTIDKKAATNYKKIIANEILPLNIQNLSLCPNLVQLKATHEDQQRFYIIQELCQCSLQEEFKQLQNSETWYTQGQIMDIMKQIVQGYKSMVDNKIIHRDIKPANILIKILNQGTREETKQYKLADFGFCKELQDLYQKDYITQCGTLQYLAPQISNKQKFSAQCDVYSLGIVFYQLIFKGELPYYFLEIQKFQKEIKVQPFKITKEADYLQSDFKYQVYQLIQKMIVYEENDRLTCHNLINHPLFEDNNKIQSILNYENNQLLQQMEKIIQIQFNKYKICQKFIEELIQQFSQYSSIQLQSLIYQIQERKFYYIDYCYGLIQGCIQNLNSLIDINNLLNQIKIIKQYFKQHNITMFNIINQQYWKEKSNLKNVRLQFEKYLINQQNDILKQSQLQQIRESTYKQLFIIQLISNLNKVLDELNKRNSLNNLSVKNQKLLRKIQQFEEKYKIENHKDIIMDELKE